jgi:ribosomal protein S18 acetylase RimI-like enzyme
VNARVSLCPLTRSHAGALAAWHPRPLTGGERFAILPAAGTDEPIGVITCDDDAPTDGWRTVRDIALAPGHRGWGYGSEAVRLFEASGRKNRAEWLLAEIDPNIGLALFFWLRLGFRPARAREVFWRKDKPGATIAMNKRLDGTRTRNR